MTDLERVKELLVESGFSNNHVDSDVCISCGKPFTFDNVYSDAGWMETQISGLCELCFDAITKEDETETDQLP